MTDVLQEIFKGIIDGDTQLTVSKVEEALKQGIDAETILNQGMVASMAEVGKLFEAGEFFVPEMMVSTRAMQNGLNLLKPHLVKANVKSAGKVAAGTVQGDLHDIGKNLVCLMLEGAGFEIIDLGVNVTPQQFIDAIRTKGAELIVMSALLTTTMTSMQDTITALKESGLPRQGQGNGWRCSRDGTICRPDRRGRIRPGCQPSRYIGQKIDGNIAILPDKLMEAFGEKI